MSVQGRGLVKKPRQQDEVVQAQTRGTLNRLAVVPQLAPAAATTRTTRQQAPAAVKREREPTADRETEMHVAEVQIQNGWMMTWD